MLHDFLGLSVSFEASVAEGYYTISHENVIVLKIIDCFWALVEGDNYLSNEYLPQTIHYYVSDYIPENELSVLYGLEKDIIEVSEHGYICNADIFASAFFCLSRWEEYLDYPVDDYGRFVAENSFLVQHNLIKRPLVCEYTVFLKDVLSDILSIDITIPFQFTQYTTHDIDQPVRWPDLFSIVKTVSADIIKRKNITLAYKNLSKYIKGVTDFDTIAEFLQLAEKSNAISVFYFLMNEQNITLLQQHCNHWKELLESHGCKLGLHPDINSFTPDSYHSQIAQFQSLFNQVPKETRQHYLQWKWPETLQLLDSHNLHIDSSLYFTDYAGFRTSCCWEFYLFDVKKRETTHVKERTLSFMDITLQKTAKTPQELWEDVIGIKNTVKKYNGDFVTLWHNSSLYNSFWKEQYKEFERMFFSGE